MVRSNMMTCLMMSCLLRVQFCAKNRASCDVLQKDSCISPGQFVPIFRNIINEIVIHILISYKYNNAAGRSAYNNGAGRSAFSSNES